MTKVNPLKEKETVPSSLALVLKSWMKVKYYLQHFRMLQNPPHFTKVPPKLPPQKYSPHSALATSNLPDHRLGWSLLMSGYVDIAGGSILSLPTTDLYCQ